MEKDKCLNCGEDNFIELHLGGGYSTIVPDKVVFAGVPMYYKVCVNCGIVHSSYIKNLNKIAKWKKKEDYEYGGIHEKRYYKRRYTCFSGNIFNL